jgi:aspartate-semialdehyde dehydrogenase
MSSSSRIPVAVVGATGLAGQQFLASLAGHPMFEIRKLAASSRSAGKKYAEAVKDDKGASKWFCTEPLSAEHAGIVVEDSAAMTTDGIRLVFSAGRGSCRPDRTAPPSAWRSRSSRSTTRSACRAC